MAKHEDVLLGRVILKKGWLSKEAILRALSEVEKIRSHDPKITLADYLGVKEILTWDQISEARKAVQLLVQQTDAAKVHAHAAGRPVSRKSAATRRSSDSRRRPTAPHRRGAVTHVRGVRDSHALRRRKRSNAAPVVALVAAACVLVMVLFFVMSSESGQAPQNPGPSSASAGKESPPPSATAYEEKIAYDGLRRQGIEPAERLARAQNFLKRYPNSIFAGEVRRIAETARAEVETKAEVAYQNLEREFRTAFEKHAFSDLIRKLHAFAERFKGTQAAQRALLAVEDVKRKWARAAAEKLDEIEVLAESGNIQEAISATKDLLVWCDSAHAGMAQLKLQELVQRSSAVASAVRSEPRSSTEPEVVVAGAEDLFGPSSGEETTQSAAKESPAEPETQQAASPSQSTGESATVASKEVQDDYSDLFGPDASEDLFGEETTVKVSGPRHPLAVAVEKQGKKKVEKELARVFNCTAVEVLKDGRVKIGYDFSTRETRLAKDWRPRIGRKGRIRWSVDWEGDLHRIFYGVRISEKGLLIADIPLQEKFSVELSFNNPSTPTKRTRMIVGVLDEKNKMWYGTDFGAAVRADAKGVVKESNGHREVPEALTIRWYRVDYEDGKITTHMALAGGRGGGIGFIFQFEPNYRKTGELAVPKNLRDVKPGILFYATVGTIGQVRITGFVDPDWLRERVAATGADLDLDVIKLDEI